MPTEVLVKTGSAALTQIVFGDHAGDHAPAAKTSYESDGGTSKDVQLTFASVADTAARESAKVDLGAVRAARYDVNISIEFAATPTTGALFELYWAPSPISTPANGNPMNIDGVDAAAPSGIGTLAELVAVCQFVGVFVVTNDPTTAVMGGHIGVFSPSQRHGILIIKNETGAAVHSDDVECHVTFDAIIDEAQ